MLAAVVLSGSFQCQLESPKLKVARITVQWNMVMMMIKSNKVWHVGMLGVDDTNCSGAHRNKRR